MNIAFKITFMILCICGNVYATDLDLSKYQLDHGAIAVHSDKTFVDPYFASKALLVANQLGLDASKQAKEWISWMLRNTNEHKLFPRFCVHGTVLSACKPADADDALLGVWMHLLVDFSKNDAMPPSWHRSFSLADQYLDATLFDNATGLYMISIENRVGLLMDNMEIYAALIEAVNYYTKQRDYDRAKYYSNRASQLHYGIQKVFWIPQTQRYLVSTQSLTEKAFYPYQVAQLFPLTTGFPLDAISPKQHYLRWMKQHRRQWLSMQSDHYPWGLIAVAAYQMSDELTVNCWLSRATRLRNTDRWNVLEEAIYQGLAAKAGDFKLQHSCT